MRRAAKCVKVAAVKCAGIQTNTRAHIHMYIRDKNSITNTRLVQKRIHSKRNAKIHAN